MPNIEVKLRRGTTAQHSTFTGAEGEVTVDTDKDTVIVHDGTTAGGHELRRKDDDITAADISSTDSTFSIDGSGNMGLGIAANTAAKLYIAGTGGNTFLAVKSDTMAAIDLEDNGAGTDQKHYQMVSLDGAFELRQVNDNLTLKDTPFTVGSSGGVGIGKVNSGTAQLEVDGDILIEDSNDNNPVAVLKGSAGAVVQLNDTSTTGTDNGIYNLSSSDGAFSIGSIKDAGTPRVTILQLLPKGSTSPGGVARIYPITVAELQATETGFTAEDGMIAYVSDGDSGSPCLAVHDGSSFKRVALGTTISAT